LDSLPIVSNTPIRRKKRALQPHPATAIRSSSFSPKVEAFLGVVTSPRHHAIFSIIYD
jgi:hypothetical protein